MTDYIKREDAIETVYHIRKKPADDEWAEKWLTPLQDIPSADVVEADKAQKEIDYWHDKAQSYEQTILKLSLNKADVVEVVRCKDCKYWQELLPVCERIHRAGWGVNDYCSFGERAEA